MPTRRNLVISAVGDESVHETWLSQEPARSFDVALIYFGDRIGRYANQAEHYEEQKGIKYRLIYEFFTKHHNIASQYDLIWCPDDDIACDTKSINRFFGLMNKYNLQIAQPSIREGECDFQALHQHKDYLLRYTRYVEIMCPAFTREAIQRVRPTFVENTSAWGIDWVWANFYGKQQVGVIDAVGVHHTRPVRAGGVHRELDSQGVDPEAEFDTVLKKYHIRNRRYRKSIYNDTARLRAIDSAGHSVWTRPLWKRPGKVA